MVKYLFILISCILSIAVYAQDLEITVDADTVNMNEVFGVEYILEARCAENSLEFENFDIVRGPNISKSMQYSDGEFSVETRLQYFLKAKEDGIFSLPNEMCGHLSKKPITIVVNDTKKPLEKRKKGAVIKRKVKKI